MFLYHLDRCKTLRSFSSAKKKKKSHADMKSTTRFISYFITSSTSQYILYLASSVKALISFNCFSAVLTSRRALFKDLGSLEFSGCYNL